MNRRGLARIAWVNRAAKRAIGGLPYVLRKVVLDIIHNGVRRRPPWSGVYRSFDDVKDAVYPSPETRFGFAKQGLSIRRDEASSLVTLRRSHALLPLAVALMARCNQPLRILDFGGSGGIDYVGVSETTDADIRYHIVETSATCDAGRRLWPGNARISFSETMPPHGEQFDIIYAWSAVHYVPEPLSLMASFALYRPKAILIVGSPFAQKAFVRAQRGAGGHFPQWVMSLPETERTMKEVGYKLSFRATDESDYNVDNYPPEYRVGSSAILLFTPRKAMT